MMQFMHLFGLSHEQCMLQSTLKADSAVLVFSDPPSHSFRRSSASIASNSAFSVGSSGRCGARGTGSGGRGVAGPGVGTTGSGRDWAEGRRAVAPGWGDWSFLFFRLLGRSPYAHTHTQFAS